jgi:hypothetical protein
MFWTYQWLNNSIFLDICAPKRDTETTAET